MHIHKIAIENYKSINSLQEIQFASGFNVVVGANNSGKTTLVEALTTHFEDKPHRTLKTVSISGGSPLGHSSVRVNFEITRQELLEVISQNWPEFYLSSVPGQSIEIQKQRIEEAFQRPNWHIECTYNHGGLVQVTVPEIDHPQRGLVVKYELHNPEDLPKFAGQNISLGREQNTLIQYLGQLVTQRIFHFRAERFHAGQSPIGSNPEIRSDASNLAQVLHIQQTLNPAMFARLVKLVNIIFPDILQITVPPIPGESKQVKIFLWFVDPSSEREDLAIPLQESGTGISQVLAILYAAISSRFSRPIIIDEPQSFLHPTALRKLTDVLKNEFPQHQYIVTTHSPLLIAAADPHMIISLTKEGLETRFKTIDASQAEDLASVLSAVGARLSDVFGAEKILWVEGPTEEKAYPAIVTKILRKRLLGNAILGVHSVGDLEGRNREAVLRIYQRLSQGGLLIPPAVGFLFDREVRAESEIIDLERQGKVNGISIRFIKRRMYENYLLDNDAIAYLISRLENFSETAVTVDDIFRWIDVHRWDRKYFKDLPASNERNINNWLKLIHGATLLDDLFKELSEQRYDYYGSKPSYGIALTNWLIENRPDSLTDIAHILDEMLVSITL